MLEQPDTGESRGIAIVSLKLALSQEARASLAAVRVAQETAQRRARRQTIETRIGVALMAGAIAVGAVAWGPRVTHWRQSRAHAGKAGPQAAPSSLASLSTSARTLAVTPRPASVAATFPAAQAPIAAHPARPAIAAQPAVAAQPTIAAHPAQPTIAAQPMIAQPTAAALRAPGASAAKAASPVAAQAKESDSGAPAEGCDTSSGRGLWRRSPEACARAFAADPNNASLALAVAQAEHAHARLDEAAQWAKRALALDPNAAEAYIIIARADAENGHDDDARVAYQRYLEVAPRGWHKTEARAALRRLTVSSR